MLCAALYGGSVTHGARAGRSSAGTATDANLGRATTGQLAAAHGPEIVAVTLILGCVAVFGVGDPLLVAALVALCPIAAAAGVVDAATRRIPTPLAVAAASVGVVGLGVAAASIGAPATYGRALAAGVAVAAFYLVLWRFVGVGAGDVRLAAALGIFAGWAGWPCVAAFVVLSHLLALPFALWKLARHGADDVPFGPALVGGAYLAIALVGVAP